METTHLNILHDALSCRLLSSDAVRVLAVVLVADPRRIKSITAVRELSGIERPTRCLTELQEAGLLSFARDGRKLTVTRGTLADFSVWRNQFAPDTLLPIEG